MQHAYHVTAGKHLYFTTTAAAAALMLHLSRLYLLTADLITVDKAMLLTFNMLGFMQIVSSPLTSASYSGSC